jgi:hypothetical protein
LSHKVQLIPTLLNKIQAHPWSSSGADGEAEEETEVQTLPPPIGSIYKANYLN